MRPADSAQNELMVRDPRDDQLASIVCPQQHAAGIWPTDPHQSVNPVRVAVASARHYLSVAISNAISTNSGTRGGSQTCRFDGMINGTDLHSEPDHPLGRDPVTAWNSSGSVG